MTTPLDELATRAAAALDQAAQQRADSLSLDGLRQRRRARQRRRGAAGTALVLGLVMVAAVVVVVVRPGPDRTTLLERPSTTPTPVPASVVDASEPEEDAVGDREAGWHSLPAAPLRAAFGAAAAWTGEEFVVWGGYAGGGTAEEQAVADAAAYDPAADRWRNLDDAPIPGAHQGGAIWTGEEVWVLGGFGGEAGREAMRGAAAYDPAADRWRVLPELPAPMVAAAWFDTTAAVLTADGVLWTLGSDGQAWVQATSSTFAPPFTATSGDGALLVVAASRLHTLTVVDADTALDGGTEDLLGLDATAQDQRMGVAATMVDDGDLSLDTISAVVIGEAGTRVSTLGASLHWRMEDPPTARFLDAVHVVDERRVVAVDSATSGHLELLDVAVGGWERLESPPHAHGHSPATAAGDGMVFTWGGASSRNLPHDQGALLILPPASPLTWPPGRADDVIPSFTTTPMSLGLPADLDPDPGPVPPIIAPPAVWAVRSTADGTAVLVQHTNNDPGRTRSLALPGPPLTTLGWSDLIWAAGPAADGGVRVVQATWQEIVSHLGTITVPFRSDPDRPLRIAPTADGAWISGLLDDDGGPLIIRIDQATGAVTAQATTAGIVFPAGGPDEVLLLDDSTLTRVTAEDLTPVAAHPLPEALGQVTQVWDDRGVTVLLGEDAAGAPRMWTVGETLVREPQLTEPVVAADARPYDGVIALATADGQVEVIDLSDPGPGQLLDTGYDAAVRHIRLHLGMRVDVTYSDGHTSTHTAPTD